MCGLRFVCVCGLRFVCVCVTSSSLLAHASTRAMSLSVSDAMRSHESCTDDIVIVIIEEEEEAACSSSPGGDKVTGEKVGVRLGLG